jgi:peptidyl-prolyl cis-trans isomerase SurA
MKFCTLFLILFSLQTQAVLLDKIVAVFNERAISLSQIKRVRENLTARRNISPQIFTKDKYSLKELVQLELNRSLVREKLTEMGYVVSDDQVEAQIKNTEDRLGLSRSALLDFLKNNNFTFDEYFELIRGSIEYNLFISRVIQPLVSITEQDIKNAYYQKYSNQKRMSFNYNLVDFSLPKSKFKKGMLKSFNKVMTEFQKTGNLPSNFADVSSNALGAVSEDGLTKKMNKLLNKTAEESFSKPILLGGDYHVFYVKKKDLVESDHYLTQKNQIQARIFQSSVGSISKSWFVSESDKHYIKVFL